MPHRTRLASIVCILSLALLAGCGETPSRPQPEPVAENDDGAQEQPVRVPSTVDAIDVKSFGAVGDGKADDTEAVQRAIEAAMLPSVRDPLLVRPGELRFPPGHYRVTKPLVIRGGTIVLKGTGPVDSFGGTPGQKRARRPRAGTQLIYDGPAGGVLLDVIGSGGLQIEDLGFIGMDKASVLLRINSEKGAGAGRFYFETCVFADADTGIECGNTDWPKNAADMTFNTILFAELKTGFRTQATPNIDYTFIRPHCRNVDLVFHFVKGGVCYASNATMVNCGLGIRIEGCGKNTGVFCFDLLRMESARKRAYRLIEVDGPETAMVVFNALNMQTNRAGREAGDARPLMDLGPNAQVVVNGGLFTNGPIARLRGSAAGGPTWLQINDCRFDPWGGHNIDPWREGVIDADDLSGFEIRNCTVQGRLLKQYGHYPEDMLVPVKEDGTIEFASPVAEDPQ